MSFHKAIIVYCSPGGTTRHVAGVMMQQCQSLGIDVQELNLARQPDMETIIDRIAHAPEGLCLFIGSPVYVSHAIPPVMDLIARLPEGRDIPVVPFVTWGGACSGMALFEMGRALEAKGMVPVGAAKILAVHSMLWRSENPVGQGHPDAEDDRLIRDLVTHVHDQLSRGNKAAVATADLTHYPAAVRKEMARVDLKMAAAHMPAREVDEAACTTCGQCVDDCPTDAITLAPAPVFGETCIYCYRCVRECPEEAIRVDLSGVEARIRERVKQFDEQPLSQIFYMSDT
jgi:ferredoxin/flavodoxin